MKRIFQGDSNFRVLITVKATLKNILQDLKTRMNNKMSLKVTITALLMIDLVIPNFLY
jgi:hypothetical protein